ncbi:MAG: YkgJ family cysteine cluster protein [Candidatus Omnitrophota bacterium]|nr:YkgJ family cysteine cluster protein [Candidatus Omnitrophota bacterium]
MKRSSKLTIDARNKKIFFGNGNCDEVRDLCEAICCRVYNVTTTEEEFRSGEYRARAVCAVSGKECENEKANCVNRNLWIERKPDGACVYLGEDNKCSIYERRPKACREFSCKEGWRITYAYRSKEREELERQEKQRKEYLAKTLTEDMKFIRNPVIRLKTLFYRKNKKQIFLVKDQVNKCGYVSDSASFDSFGLDDAALIHLVSLFDGRRDLGTIRREITKRYGVGLSREDFHEILWFFFGESIILFRHDIKGICPSG